MLLLLLKKETSLQLQPFQTDTYFLRGEQLHPKEQKEMATYIYHWLGIAKILSANIAH